MVSYTIDFISSIVIVTVLLTSSIILVSQDLTRAEIYQQEQQMSLKVADILNNVLQNTGSPQNWGQTEDVPISFGMNMPNQEYLTPSPFTPLRLMLRSDRIIYNNIEYRNLTTEYTHLFLKSSEYVTYDDSAGLLALENDFGFSISLKPILNISVSQLETNPLRIGIFVQGLSGSVAGALLNATLFTVIKSTPFPSFSNPIRGCALSDIIGSAEIEFPMINTSDTLYIVLVKANLGGTTGVGYVTNMHSSDSPILPLLTDYNEGQVSLVHRGNITSYAYSGEIYYNLTFINQLGKTDFHPVKLETSSGIVNTSNSDTVNLSVGNTGILLVSSRAAGEYDLTIMPWGITPLPMTVKYGADPLNKKTVVKTSQFVSIDGLSYEIEIALWKFNAEN